MSLDVSSVRPPRSISRWLRMGLVLSLALNVIGISALATWMLRGTVVERVMIGGYTQLVPRKFLASLPEDKRQQVRVILKAHRREVSAGRAAIRETTMRLADAIAATPYDAAKVRSIIADFAAQSGGLVSNGGEAALQVLNLLTAEERAALAADLRSRTGSAGYRR